MSMKDISRRDFLKIFGAGTVATAATMVGCQNKVGNLA
ncbi:MAG: twin-arginine translocation signal domain-containing protein, partial [Bacteroidales bacterium]|nr:twin-arginine translocation signal domain-containing protein [Bacteroidales bacterium]